MAAESVVVVVVVGAGVSIGVGAVTAVSTVVVVSVVLLSLQDAANRPSARAIAPNFTIFMMFVFCGCFDIYTRHKKR